MIDLDDLSDRKNVFRIIYKDADGNKKTVEREEDSVDIMGALAGTCVWFSTGKTGREGHELTVVPWHRVIEVGNTVDR